MIPLVPRPLLAQDGFSWQKKILIKTLSHTREKAHSQHRILIDWEMRSCRKSGNIRYLLENPVVSYQYWPFVAQIRWASLCWRSWLPLFSRSCSGPRALQDLPKKTCIHTSHCPTASKRVTMDRAESETKLGFIRMATNRWRGLYEVYSLYHTYLASVTSIYAFYHHHRYKKANPPFATALGREIAQ